MIFHAHSLLALKCLEKFEVHYQEKVDGQDPQVLEKVKRCGYQVVLIAGDKLALGGGRPTMIDKKTLLALSAAWRSICAVDGRQKTALNKSWQIIDLIGEGIHFNWESPSLYIRRFRQPAEEGFIFILLSGAERVGLPAYELFLLSHIWQFEQGFLPVHASGIQHKDQLYLFTGPSGAGKSTVADLSSEVGDQVVDEDQVLIHLLPGGGYSADGWGYGIVPCEAPLRAIFSLVQDSEDRLIPLNPLQVGRLILERQNDVMGGLLTEDLLRQSFCRASEMARQVPGFELHFRKSPDFWKLIDAQFPD
jgi:hypothetical protein